MDKNKANDQFKFFGKIPEQGKDYIETEDTFTILNVPILAEMVQRYGDGYALKSADEILKVEVNNIPLTIVDNEPTHPDFIGNSDTLKKSSVIVGYMSEPMQPKKKPSKTKRYADFVLHNTPKIDALKTEYLSGNIIDTSIGFDFEYDNTPGEFLGLKYDYIQRNIKLDHNAILIDRIGNIATGRMPAPIGGIGADKGETKMKDEDIMLSLNTMANNLLKNNPDLNLENAYSLISDALYKIRYPNDKDGGNTMADDKKIDSLTKENEDLKKQIDELKQANDKKDAADIEAVKTELDTVKKEADSLKVENADMKKELDEAKDKLKVYLDKDAEILNSKRDELKKHYADLAELFDKADAEFIEKKFDELQKKNDKKDIGADMFGPAKVEGKKETERIMAYSGQKKKTE